MNSLRTIAGLAWVAAAVAPVQAQVPSHEFTAESGTIDQETQARDLRFRSDRYSRMTVPVRLSGSGPFRFLIDTGSDRTVVSRQLANRLNLEPASTANLHSVTGETEVNTANVPHLDLSAKTVRNIEAALLDKTHMGADGILGLDSLRSQRILFDFKAQTLTIVPASDRVYREEDEIVVTAKRRKGRLVVTKARAEDTRVTVVVDTGAEITIGNNALLRSLLREDQVRPTGPIELISVTGEKLVGEVMLVKRVEIGGMVLENLAVVFADSHAFETLGLMRKPAVLLGMNALQAFEKVSIDFARMKLRVVLPEKSELDQTVMASR